MSLSHMRRWSVCAGSGFLFYPEVIARGTDSLARHFTQQVGRADGFDLGRSGGEILLQRRKAAGRFRRVFIVHHIKHLRQRPDLALSVFDPDTGARQLETLCKRCHELEHPESQRQYAPQTPPLTAERWD